jgi:hypothetical protein
MAPYLPIPRPQRHPAALAGTSRGPGAHEAAAAALALGFFLLFLLCTFFFFEFIMSV